MTSPSSKLFASAELTPELASRTEAAQGLLQLLTPKSIYTKPASAQDTPLSSPPSSSQVSVTDGSPYPPATLSFPPPAIRLAPIGYPQSLRGRKGTTSSTKCRIQKSQRDCQGAKSPAGQSLARRGHGSSRTPASGRPDAGPRPLFQARELPRLSADQNPVPSDPPSSRPGGNGDRTMRPSSTSISASNIAGFSPSLPTQIPVDPPRFPVNLSTGHYTYPKQNILSNASSPNYSHRTIPLPLPIGPTPSQPHESLSRQSSPFSSAAFDGFKILRKAVPIVLVRILVSRLNKGLPVNGYSETHLEYVTPLQGHLLRDVFNSHCHHHLQEFHTPMQENISALPKTTVVGSFLSGDPKDVKYTRLHVGCKDEIHVHIALNKLCSETGLHTILKGSHLSRHPSWTPEANWAHGDINLEEGDAMIWRGDMPYFLSSGGGGRWLRLTYEWDPIIIDLT